MAKKRGQGEGSIFKRKDGYWVAQMTIQGKHVSKYFQSQREARDWIQETRTQVQAGLTFAGAQSTLSSFLREWLVSNTNSVRPKTYDQYEQVVSQHIVPVLGEVKLKDLRPDQIQFLYNQKINNGASARTVKLIHSVLHRALNQALKWGTIGRNPAQAVSRPKITRKEMKVLTDGQVRVLLSASKETRFEALYWLAVTTGMRQGELLGLKWADIDWVNRHLRIQRQLQRIRGSLVFSDPKTASGRRVIVVGEATIQVLKKHQTYQNTERRITVDLWQENDLIFPSTIGTPMDPSNLYHHYKHLLKRAGLPNIRFHDLRHTAATLMLQQGTHPKIVQERLGHSDISMTLNTYSHVLPAMQDETAEKMDELLKIINVSEEIKKLSERSPIYSSFV